MSRRWVVVALIFAGILVSYIDRGNLSIAAASLMSEFRIDPAAMGLLLSAFFWTYGAFQLPAGALVDRIGVRRVYAAAFLLWSCASAGIALSRGPGDVFGLRLALGLTEAVGPIASLTFIRKNFSGREQGLPTAIYIAGQNIGPALGTLLGSVLLVSVGWRWMFAATGLGALVWLPFWWALAPRDQPAAQTAKPVDPDQDTPADWLRVFSSGGFWAMCAASFLSSYFWYFLLTWVPAYLTLSRGFTTLEMGRILSAPLFLMAVLNVAGGAVADRLAKRLGSVFGVRLPFTAAAYGGAASILLLLVLPARAAVLPILILSVCCIGLGNANYWAMVQHLPPANKVGRTVGFLNTLSQAAGAAAPLITGWILGPEKRFQTAILIAGLCPLAAGICLAAAGPSGLERTRRALGSTALP